MEKIILYTKKFELNFDDQSVSKIDVTELIEELSKEYELLDRNPSITIEGKFQYVTWKLSPKKEKRSVGFNR
ncbi:MAG: hypothetical protein ACJ75J_03080 [Cytophagaceae bacterium]|jgi:hypothetical protein